MTINDVAPPAGAGETVIEVKTQGGKVFSGRSGIARADALRRALRG